MTEVTAVPSVELTLPPTVVSKVDVSRLATELERIDSEFNAMSVRSQAGVAQTVMPVLSQKLTDFCIQNKVSLKEARERSDLIKRVRALKDNVPVIHMTFAVPADDESLATLAQWLRSSIHPQAVIATGLQPALVAGVYVRTPNHIHDLSLRAKLAGGHDLLVSQLGALRGAK